MYYQLYPEEAKGEEEEPKEVELMGEPEEAPDQVVPDASQGEASDTFGVAPSMDD